MPAPVKPAAPGAKQRLRPEARLRIAALLSTHPPAGKIKLASDPEQSLYSELEFEPIPLPAGTAAHGVGFGLLHSGYLPRGLSYARIPVKRGRWGGKPPEYLQLLQPMPEELLAQPALKQRGVLRSIALAYADLAGAQATRPAESGAGAPRSPERTLQSSVPTKTTLLLAVELALHGWAEQARLAAFAAQQGEAVPLCTRGPDAPLVESAGLLLWRAYLRRLAERLGELLQHSKQRNPLRTELSETQVAGLLDLKQPGIGGAVLSEFAAQHKLKLIHNAYPRSYALSGAYAPPALDADAAACVKAVLADLASNPAASRREFNLRFPGQLNVIAWIYDSETLIELPGWYTVTRDSLRRYVKQIPAGPGQRVPSVRDIKDKLGLARREAESLRSWYLVQHAPAIGKQGSRI